ncbi:MAG: A/G-specific adenine glycosylase [Reyranella sp.]|nr:A/G-specific adenine glycosylase [Reyranella sp.]
MAITHAPQHAQRLLAWYDRHRRTLPWRAPAGERTAPYLVWLSEIMLQQTTVATVGDYYRRFVARWPTVEALAAAPLDEVLSAWAGLGYYARARNLHACAQAVTERHGGRFPEDEAGLRALPGIGPYTAAAIRAIAFDLKASAVDGNVERVIARLEAIETPLPDAKVEITARAAERVPDQRAGDYAQAMMDLGATVCTPRKPLCVICPLTRHCRALKRGMAETLPRRSPKALKPTRRGLAFVLARKDGAVLLRKRPPKGLLGGMDEVPSSPWREGKFSPADALADAPLPAKWTLLDGLVRHTFTHFHLELSVARATATTDRLARLLPGSAWCTLDLLDDRALPTVMRKVIEKASLS